MECEDRCGDSVIVNKPCDDGNTKNGDGCSSKCFIEFGYECLVPGKPCREIIPPTFKITSNSQSGQFFVQFSEAVIVNSDYAIYPLTDTVKVD
jgi:cysteine-rich repeat protein